MLVKRALNLLVNIVALNVDGTEGSCGAEVFASAASDALLFVDDRNNVCGIHVDGLIVTVHPSSAFVLMQAFALGHHLDGFGWTVASTVVAFLGFIGRDTVLAHPNGMAYLNRRAFLYRDGPYGFCGTYLRATVTLGSAVPTLEAYLGLHEVFQVATRTQASFGHASTQSWQAVQ